MGGGETETKCNIDKPKSGQHSSGHWQWAPAECASGAERRDESSRVETFFGDWFGFQSKQASKTNKQSISITSIMRRNNFSLVHCPLSTVHCRLFACLITASTQHFSLYLFIVSPLSLSLSLCHSWGDTLKRRTILSMLIILIGAT